jgi:hypothetical protein
VTYLVKRILNEELSRKGVANLEVSSSSWHHHYVTVALASVPSVVSNFHDLYEDVLKALLDLERMEILKVFQLSRAAVSFPLMTSLTFHSFASAIPSTDGISSREHEASQTRHSCVRAFPPSLYIPSSLGNAA